MRKAAASAVRKAAASAVKKAAASAVKKTASAVRKAAASAVTRAAAFAVRKAAAFFYEKHCLCCEWPLQACLELPLASVDFQLARNLKQMRSTHGGVRMHPGLLIGCHIPEFGQCRAAAGLVHQGRCWFFTEAHRGLSITLQVSDGLMCQRTAAHCNLLPTVCACEASELGLETPNTCPVAAGNPDHHTVLSWNPYLAYVGLQLANGQRLALSLPLHEHRLLPQLVLS